MSPRNFLALGSVAALATGIGARPVAAQAICSAPHSSPTLGGGNSIGTLPAGTGWVMLSALSLTTRSAFDSRGDRRALLADGRFRVSSAYLSAGVGLAPGVDIWGQVPFHSMRYVDVGGERSRTGIGDARFALRLSPDLVGLQAPIALRIGLKIPGSTFPVDATVIPLTEGQRDVETSLESGRTFSNSAYYVMGWVGYRWRGTNTAADRKPGDEVFVHTAVGTAIGGTRVELGADVLRGRTPRQLGFGVPAAHREMFQLVPTVTRKIGVGDFEVTGVIPAVGRNLPTGPGVAIGYRIGWDRRRPQMPGPDGFGPPQ